MATASPFIVVSWLALLVRSGKRVAYLRIRLAGRWTISEEEGDQPGRPSRQEWFYTIISLLNFDAYQRGVSQHFSAEYGAAEFEDAPDMGLEGDRQLSGAELGCGVSCRRSYH